MPKLVEASLGQAVDEDEDGDFLSECYGDVGSEFAYDESVICPEVCKAVTEADTEPAKSENIAVPVPDCRWRFAELAREAAEAPGNDSSSTAPSCGQNIDLGELFPNLLFHQPQPTQNAATAPSMQRISLRAEAVLFTPSDSRVLP